VVEEGDIVGRRVGEVVFAILALQSLCLVIRGLVSLRSSRQLLSMGGGQCFVCFVGGSDDQARARAAADFQKLGVSAATAGAGSGLITCQ
jgi:hypothetical protein